MTLEVSVEHERGRVRLVRAQCVVASGQAMSLDGIRNQIQDGLVPSASWTLYEAVTYGTGGVTSRDGSGAARLAMTRIG
ncbi:MAG: molybdopterin cofactor-binding domain-containing protein [Janthinobacterium lividum]